MRKNNLSINSENILPIIKKWLYSSRDIFLRELISNSCDAIRKLKTLRELGQAEKGSEDFAIHVQVDKQNRTLTISDNGIGMTEEEVEKYIAQIAFSGAEEFMNKYQMQSNSTSSESMIGHFGLGFYSSYMVAERVDVITRSFISGSQGVFWSCDGSSSYEIGEASRGERGTDIVLHIDEASTEYLEEGKVRELLERFCSFMPEPIFLNGKALDNGVPLWMKNPSECTEVEYRTFYRKLYPMDPEPVFWIHLNVDYPFRLQGILYSPPLSHRIDDRLGAIQLYCHRVFVSADCREILPEYLSLLRGALDSPDIPLNVSRSYLQVDQNVRQLGAHIGKKVADRLQTLYKTDRERYIACWPDVESLVKFGILRDDKFYDRVKEALIWKNDRGEWTTVQEYLERAKERKVYYCTPDCATVIQQLFTARGVELLYAGDPIHAAVIHLLEDKLQPVQFQRIDSALDAALLDESKEKTVLDAEGKTVAGQIAELFRQNLSEEKVDVEAKSLASDVLPGMILLDEKSRRWRDFLALTDKKAAAGFQQRTFVVNTNNKLVLSILQLASQKPDLAKALIKQVYDMAQIAQKEADPSDINPILERNQLLIEELTCLVSKGSVLIK